MPEFKRYTVVGFDLRKKPLLDLGGPKKLGDYWPTDHPQPFPYPATISSQTWPQSAAVEALRQAETNGINLFFLPDAARLDADGVSVAFSLRSADSAVFEQYSYVLPIDEGFLSQARGWRLLGHDVADAWLAHSIFYGFTWKPGEMAEIEALVELEFNRYGLLDDEALAVRIADYFSGSNGIESHAPFYPVRVWMQE